MNVVLENHSKAQLFRLVTWLNIILSLRKTIHNLVRKFYLEYSSDMSWKRNLERRYFGRRHWGVGNVGRVRNPHSKAQCKGNNYAEEWWTFHIPDRRRHGNIVWKRSWSPRMHSKAGTTCKEWRSQRRTSRNLGQFSTDRRNKDDGEACNDFWSMKGDFIYRRHVEPRVQLCVPKEETLPIPLTYTDRDQDDAHKIWTCGKKAVLTTTGNVDVDRNLSGPRTGFAMLTLLNEKPPQGYMWSGAAYEDSSNCQTWLFVAWNFGPACRKQLRRRKSRNGLLKGQSSITLGWRAFFIDPEDGEYRGNHLKTQGKVGDTDGDGCALQNGNEAASQQAAGNRKRNQRIRQNPKDKARMHFGSSCIQEKAFGIYSTNRSWRSHRGKRIHVVLGEIDKDSNDHQTRLCMARSLDENW